MKKAPLGKMESDVQQMIQERKQKIQEFNDTVNLSKVDADRQIADGVQVLTALMRCIEKQQEDFDQTVKEKLKSTEKQAEGLIKELEQEIEDLTKRSSEVKQLTHTEDHLHFLQTFTSLKDPPPHQGLDHGGGPSSIIRRDLEEIPGPAGGDTEHADEEGALPEIISKEV